MSQNRPNKGELKLGGNKVTAAAEANATYFWISKRPEIVKREYFPLFTGRKKKKVSSAS